MPGCPLREPWAQRASPRGVHHRIPPGLKSMSPKSGRATGARPVKQMDGLPQGSGQDPARIASGGKAGLRNDAVPEAPNTTAGPLDILRGHDFHLGFPPKLMPRAFPATQGFKNFCFPNIP